MEYTVTTSFKIKKASVIPYRSIPEDAPALGMNRGMLEKIVADETSRLEQMLTQKLEAEKQTAFQEGFQQGAAQTEQNLIAQFSQAFETIQQLTGAVRAHMQGVFENEEQNILELTLKIARLVVDTEISLRPELVLGVLRNGLELLNERRQIKIFVNPQDWTTVKDSLHHLQLQVELPPDVEVVSAPEVERGGCKIDSVSGSIDAGISTQFEEITRKLLKDKTES